MSRKLGIVLGLTTVIGLAGCGTEHKSAAPAAGSAAAAKQDTGTIERSEVATITATVEAINYKKRTVTLRGPEGNSETIKVGPEARNFAQVKKGDQVTATYRESIAVTLHKKGEAEPGMAASESASRTKPGDKPGGSAAETVSVTATVMKIDRRKQTVTLQGPKGKSVTVTVKDPTRLDKVAVGDLVEITYTTALAISVEKAAK